MKTTLMLPLALVLLACGSSGPHPYDHVPGDGDELVKNPAVTLKREYWIIYAKGDKHYMIPRPDGADAIVKECMTGGPLAAKFQAAQLCTSVSSEAALNRVNSLSRDEALEVSTFLHQRLRFQVEADGITVTPYPLLSDQVDVCNANLSAPSSAVRSLCDRKLAAQKQGIAVLFSKEEASALAPLLNDLYGIP